MKAMVEALLADRMRILLDDEGRALHEQAHPEAAREETPCSYPGPRQGMPINTGALDQVARHWSAVCAELRGRVPRHATLQQAFQVSLEVVCAPLLWGEGRLPAATAAGYKACVGFCQVFAWLLLQEEPIGDEPLSALGSGSEFAHWVEEQGFLEGERRACAGSLHQIKTIFELFCSGHGAAPVPSKVLEAVALQAALVLSTALGIASGVAADDSLGCRLLERGRAPWLFSVTSRPGAPAALARRLFPSKGRVGSLERFLSGDRVSLSHAQREKLFWAAVPFRG